MLFNVNKCHILQEGTRNQKCDYEMNDTKLESAYWIKDTVISLLSRLKIFQQCKYAIGKANRMLGFMSRNFSFQNKNVILPLYISLVRPQLKYAMQFCFLIHAKDIGKLSAIQWGVTKIITSLLNNSDERLARPNLFSLEKRQLRGKSIECYEIFIGFTNVDSS